MLAVGVALAIFSIMGLFIYDIGNDKHDEASETSSSSTQVPRFSISVKDAASDDALFEIFKAASDARDLTKMALSGDLLIAKNAAWKYRGHAYIFRAECWYKQGNLKNAEECLRLVMQQTEDKKLQETAEALILAMRIKSQKLQKK